MAYNKDTNYQEEINKAVARGDYASASRLEKERNEKIDGEGLSQYTKTSNFVKPEGITDATYNAMNKQYTASERQGELDANVSKAQTNYNNVAGSNPISTKTQSALNKGYKKSSSVRKADAWLAEQLEIIQSGKTSYSDQVRDMMDKIMNRDKFSYDVDEDPLFQQALASAMKSGQQAMTDTIGQASALTGGYGSTYATTAGNQAYNAYVEDAYDNLPQYYQMAREAYDKEGEEMYRQFGMVSELDDKEYNRNLAAYDATYQHRNALYNEEYGRYRDEKSDAFSMAGLEVDLYGHKVNNALNAYNMAKDMADTEYERNYKSWLDSINIAMQKGQLERGAYEYDKSFDESVRQYEQNYEQTEKWNQKQMDYNYAALDARGSGGGGSGSGGSGDGQGVSNEKISKYAGDAIKDIKKNGRQNLTYYISTLGLSDADEGRVMEEVIYRLGLEGDTIPYNQRFYYRKQDSFWDESEDKYVDNYGNEYTKTELESKLGDDFGDLGWINEDEYYEFRTDEQKKFDAALGLNTDFYNKIDWKKTKGKRVNY